MVDQEFTKPLYREIPEADGALEYAVQGWFKITGEMNPKKIYALFRISDWPENLLEKNTKVGDRTLAFTYLEKKFCFVTYHYGMQTDSSLIQVVQKIDNEVEDGNWIFLYFGYSLV